MAASAIRRVGFIGLGAMGARMAALLLRKQFALAVYDIRPEAGQGLASQGAHAAGSPAEAAREADAVILMVHNYDQVRSVLLGDESILAALAPGALVILMSTVSPAQAREAGAACAERDVGLLDAPVSGGVARAASGELSIMLGGPAEVVAAARPLLEALGDPARVWHVGPNPGDGQAMKTINQLLVGVHIVAAAEALALAAGMGLDGEQVFDVIRNSLGNSAAFENRAPRVLDGTFTPPISRLDIFVKDMGIVADAARAVGLDLPLAEAARQLFERGLAEGLGDEDDVGLIRLYEQQTGKPVRRPQKGTGAP